MRISAPSDAIVVLHEVEVSQENSETSDMVKVQIQSASTDGTGSAATAVKHEQSDAAFGGSAIYDLSADTTATDVFWVKSENVLNGWHYLPTPQTQIVAPPSGRLVVRMDSVPGSSITITVRAVIEEIG